MSKILDEKVEILEMKESLLKFRLNGEIIEADYYQGKNYLDIHWTEGNFRIPLLNPKKSKNKSHQEGSLQAPMPGKIIKVLVKEGQQVSKSEILFILEAMKMEHKIIAPHAGQVQKIFFNEGERVSQGENLAELLA